jgi:MFS transporter
MRQPVRRGNGACVTSAVVKETAVVAEDRRRWLALGVIVVAQFMVVLDISIVSVALPSIKTDLHFSQESLRWVLTGYSIFFGGFLLLGGRLADLLGRRLLFMAGLSLFTVSSLLNGLAWSEGSLIAFRRLQGFRHRTCSMERLLFRSGHRRGMGAARAPTEERAASRMKSGFRKRVP